MVARLCDKYHNIVAKTMCGRTQLTMLRADPEEGAGPAGKSQIL